MKSKIFLWFYFLFICLFSFPGYAAVDNVSMPIQDLSNAQQVSISKNTEEEVMKPFLVEMQAKSVFFRRDNSFYLGNVGHWASIGDGTIGDPHDFDMNRAAGGYEVIGSVFKDHPWYLEVSCEQYFSGFKKVKQNIIGIGGGDLSVMPFIDTNFGTLSKGFLITAAVVEGANAPGNLTLKYDLEYGCCRINAVNKYYREDGYNLDLFLGPVYANFSQYYKVDTFGTNAWSDSGGMTTSSTSENLEDNLYGIHLGFRQNKRFWDKFAFECSGLADFFYRRSELDGTQNIINGANDDSYTFDATLKISRRDCGFASHLLSNFALFYYIKANTAIKFFYQFDFWNNLARICNPKISGSLTVVDNNTHLTKENVFSNSVGMAVTIGF